MMLDNFENLCENITVFQPNGTFTADGKPNYTKLLTSGIWQDSDKVIQTGLQTSITAKSKIILNVDVLNNSLIERGDVSTASTSSSKIISKKVARSVASGELEGVVIYL